MHLAGVLITAAQGFSKNHFDFPSKRTTAASKLPYVPNFLGFLHLSVLTSNDKRGS